MQIERIPSDALVVNELPDGSRILVDTGKEKVFSLNPTAGAAWDACSDPTTLTEITRKMQRSLDPGVTAEVAEEAVQQLEEQHLVRASGVLSSRRQFLAQAGAVALPLVVSLTMAEQAAYAKEARSFSNPHGPQNHEAPLPIGPSEHGTPGLNPYGPSKPGDPFLIGPTEHLTPGIKP